MTEVNPTNCQLGLFATKSYEPGDVILDEMPLIILAPKTSETADALLEIFFGRQIGNASASETKSPKSKNENRRISDPRKQLWDAISPPSSVEEVMRGIFKGMVQAGMCHILQQQQQQQQSNSSQDESLAKLYHPVPGGAPSDGEANNEDLITIGLEETIIQLAGQAVSYVKHQYQQHKLKSESNSAPISLQQKDWKQLLSTMLIWACNSFDGGRIYEQTSRINHSCNPSAIVQVVPDGSTESAALSTAVPTESNRQRILAASKISPGDEVTISYLGTMLYSETCVRNDILKATKFFTCRCPRCENTSKDLAARIPCPNCHARTPRQSLDEDDQYDDDMDNPVAYIIPGSSTQCERCGKSFADPNSLLDPKLSRVMETVRRKVVSYLQDRDQCRKTLDQYSENPEDYEEELFEHAALASTVMGAHHWTTNLLSLFDLDRRLSEMSQAMLTTQTLPDLESIAAAIDSLQRCCAFVERLDLKLHVGHLLSDVIIGVARFLVSLGDAKSQKYGAEWLDKIAEYVARFEADAGRQKVVAALRTAHEQHDKFKMDRNPDRNDDDNRKKKAKKS